MEYLIRYYEKNDKGEWKEFEPPKEDIETKCSICGSKAFKDPYGNGHCDNCGWIFEKDEVELEKSRGISYL